ncbi:phosphotransferase [Aureimonas populi]|uniref:Hydroxylysine kinase n=1 Tax=Aureimonas populi TaxID=1701758 RepID=A0ABW5CNF9_9HYPH|nr:phosphotransferase [Aureimonas populi]
MNLAMTTPGEAPRRREAPEAIGAGLSVAGGSVAPETAEEIAARHYGITGRATPLIGEKDANFRLDAADGGRFFLKILHPGESAGVSSMHTLALLHVEARAPELPVQRVVRTRAGRADFRIGLGGEERTVRLTDFTPGLAQKETEPSPAQARAVGEVLARLQGALADFRHPAEDHETSWDMARAGLLRAVLPLVRDETERALLTEILDAFDARLAPRLAALPRQMAHNDFNKDNILVDPAAPERIAGIIDFGDMLRTPVVCDVAVAAAYQLGEGGDDPLAAALPFLSGHGALNPLSEEEIALLPTAILTRMAMRLLVTQWRADRLPERADYILRNSPSVRAQLRAFAAYAPGEASARIASACQA